MLRSFPSLTLRDDDVSPRLIRPTDSDMSVAIAINAPETLINEVFDVDAKRAFRILRNGGDPGNIVARDSVLCSLVTDGTVKFIEKLSDGGASGMPIWKVKVGSTTIVAKVGRLDVVIYVNTFGVRKLGDIIDQLPIFKNLVGNLVLMINGGDPEKIIKVGDNIYVPKYAQLRAISTPLVSPSYIKGVLDSTFPVGTIVNYHDDGVGEYIMGLMVTKVSSIAPNVLKVYDFATCSLQRRQYLVMELAMGDTSVVKNVFGKTHNFITSFVQILLTLEVLQRSFKFSHNDLHVGNVFFIHPLARGLEGKTLKYTIDGSAYFVPPQLFPVIADYGFATRWKTPLILDDALLDDVTFAGGSTGGTSTNTGANAPWMPNFYCPGYDPIYLLISCANTFDDFVPILHEVFGLKVPSGVSLRQAFTTMIERLDAEGLVLKDALRPTRALCHMLNENDVTPLTILKLSIFDSYRRLMGPPPKELVEVMNVKGSVMDPIE